MERRTCILMWMLILALLLNICSVSVNSGDIKTERDSSISSEYQAVYNKISELAQIKARINQYKHKHNITESEQEPVYESLKAEADLICRELALLGAEPGEEALEQLHFESPVNINGILIENFADFYDNFRAVFDVWGVPGIVNNSYGTYFTYDIMIQDVTGGEILSSYIAQNGKAGWDLYSLSSTAVNLIESDTNSAVLDRIAEYGISTSRYTNLYSAIKSAFSSISPKSAVTVNGNSKSYIIYCDAVSTIHFVYVCDSPTGVWKHSLTTNTAAVLETHDIYMVSAKNGRPYLINESNVVYDDIILPHNYQYRLTAAVETYIHVDSVYKNSISGYSVSLKPCTADYPVKELFNIEIICPKDQAELFVIDYDNGYKSAVIYSFSTFMLCILVFCIGTVKVNLKNKRI